MRASRVRIGGNKTKVIVIIALIIAIIAGGLGVWYFGFNEKKETDNPDKPVKPIEEEKEPEVVEEKKISIVDVNSTSRPYAVMINNISTARPVQSGLQDAYIIYEFIVEGGITRYMALFLDQNTERIGSIRSARHYYIDYALENDAIYVHHGQSPQAEAEFKSTGVDRIVVSDKTGWRDKTLKLATEHTLFTSIEKLGKGIGSKRTTRNNNLLLKYSVDSLDLASKENAKEARTIKIKYSNSNSSNYVYDEENKVYLHSVNSKAHVDYVTKKQYTFKNIITYQVKNTTINDGSGKGRQELDNLGSGTGWYISEGYAVPIKWKKDTHAGQTKYTYENGEELIVNDGNTFIQVQPTGQSLTIE